MGSNTIYVADDGNAGASGTTGGQLGGLQRWDFNGTTWALSYLINQVNTGTANVFAGLRSLTVISDGSANTIYGIDTAGRLVGVVDAGASSVFTTLAVAPTGFAFRGVEMTPGTLVPTPGAAGLLALGGLVAGRRRRGR
jgi:MYXO-CTERM domain-containing protein